MADRSGRARNALTPGKLILIGVLAVVLLAVLYAQFGPSGSETEAASRRPASAQRAAVDRAQPPANRPEQTAATKRDAPHQRRRESVWETPDLATVTAYDPFAIPASFPQPQLVNETAAGGEGGGEAAESQGPDAATLALEQKRQELEQMRQLGVKVILMRHDQYVALFGDRTIRVGDEINGFTVTAITPTGVRVERKVDE